MALSPPLWVPEMQMHCSRGLLKMIILLSSVLHNCPNFFQLSSAASLVLVHGLEWCHSHLKACHFQSALFLLSTAPVFLQLKSFWDIWALYDPFFSHIALKLPVGPGHAELPSNEVTDSLTKTGATLPFVHFPSPLAPVIAKIRHIHYATWRQYLFHNSLFC